ncbi:MAG TPA: RagB/SusD family nutrient uptake outer membrane protein [Cyclobacteriaceae bacterium]|nr:RagB/SusD family nutrient uptake outer membrane protein [Cyclobacteriaceae bacterium]
MKLTYKKLFAYSAVVMVFAMSGCKDLLQEQPRSGLTPGYYTTGTGINAGLTSVYSSFKFYYGTEGGMNLSVYGTDEFTHGQQVSNPPLNVYNSQLNATIGDLQTPWNRSYGAINTCNAIIELGAEAPDLSDAQKTALLAEAKYLRAHWYFILVTTFGGVTLDLGSGPLKFNTSATNVAKRESLADCYAAIVKDLEEAAAELPDRPSAQGRVWKASALHLLSKVYLTRGWSSAAQSSDFQKSYETAKKLIDTRATYGVSLLPNYASVHQEGNEYNAEVLFQVDWMDNNQTFNNTNGFAGGEDGLRQNRSNYFFRMLYVTNMPGMIRDAANGRPFVRYKPTDWMLNTAFADKINDSRYDKSFQTVWRCNSTTTLNPNWTAADVAAGAVTQRSSGGTLIPAVAGQPKLALGDTAIFMVPNHLVSKYLPWKNKKSYVMFFPNDATSPKSYFGASNTFTSFGGYNIQNQYYPSLKKYDATQFRAGSPAGGDPNITSVRPFIVHRFAETYLIAAEAAFQMGNTAEAVTLINVVRARAAASTGAVAAMTATTAADLASGGIDYILDERTRELAGEQMRWFDLARTKKLIERVNKFNNKPAMPGTINADGTITGAAQTVPAPQPHQLLRPIPQIQLDGAVDPTSDGGKYPQNPGYN